MANEFKESSKYIEETNDEFKEYIYELQDMQNFVKVYQGDEQLSSDVKNIWLGYL